MPQTNKKITALYCRLYKEDLRLGESESIQNQKLILEHYAKESHLPNIRFFIYDGISGVEFKRREGLQEMLDEVEAGNVSTVVTKDLSRLGRDYLETGKLLEITFPQNGVRYIAVSDGVDSADGENEFTPLRNWFNEFYARETSKKIRAVKLEKARRGERVNGIAPYGYAADPDDRNHLIPDPESAAVVQKIFEMYVGGISMAGIQKWLWENKIITPAEYRRRKKDKNYDLTERSCDWHIFTIEHILQQVEYVGDTVTNKSHRTSFKLHNQKPTEDAEKFYFSNTHEALIDRNVFEQVQARIKNHSRCKKNSELDILSGLIFCGECGAKMHSIHATTGKRTCGYTCGRYRNRRQRRSGESCTAHYISQDVVMDVLFAELKRVLNYVNINEREFITVMNENAKQEAEVALVQQEDELNSAKKRVSELNVLFRKSYEDNALGKISDEQFSFLTEGFDEEKTTLDKRIAELEKDVEMPLNRMSNVKRFVSLAKKHVDFSEISYENIHELIERILIHATDLDTGTREIEIFYRYVGKIKIDVPPVSYEYHSNRSNIGIRVILS